MHPRVRSLVVSAFCLIATCLTLHGQTPRDFAIDLQAIVSDSVPRITLTWTQRLQTNINAQVIFRRLKGATSWGSALATLTLTQTSYADTTAQAGVEYEYWMDRTFSTYPSATMGFIAAGVKVPAIETRGKLLLVVDDTMLTSVNWSASGLTEISSTAASGLRTITIRDSVPMTGKRFMRLKIVQP